MAYAKAAYLNKTFEYTTPDGSHSYSIAYGQLGNGRGPPMIFVHGTPWSSKLWEPYARCFAVDFNVYLFDNPGYGESVAHGRVEDGIHSLDVSLAAQAQCFAALLEHLAMTSPPIVIAHDNGGIITLRAHLLHGAKYHNLCLVDPVALTPVNSPFMRLVAANSGVFEQVSDAMWEGLVRTYIQGAGFKTLRNEDMDTLAAPWLDAKGGKQGKAGFIRQMVQARKEDLEEVMPRYAEVGEAMPVKVIWGKEDLWIPVERATKLKAMLGAKRCVVVEDAGHLVHLDQPGVLGVELGKWVFGNV